MQKEVVKMQARKKRSEMPREIQTVKRAEIRHPSVKGFQKQSSKNSEGSKSIRHKIFQNSSSPPNL